MRRSNNSKMEIVKAENIKKSFGQLEVLKGINLSIQQSEVVSIVGASGAGKTTLLQILGTLDSPTSGRVEIHGTDVSKINEQDLSKFRNQEIGFVFQFHQLLPEFTAIENIMIPALIGGNDTKDAKAKASELLDFLNIYGRKNHKPSELSGGEKQRVAIARALINRPSVVFADEPSGNLDSHNAEDLQRLFFSLREKFGQTFVIVTHDQHLAEMCDRTIKIKDGIVEE